MSREALSLDISNLVSRVVRGETIDIPQTGAALAAKYPDLGMSGALIGQAIERAAGMVGTIRSTPVPTKRMARAAEAGKVVAPASEAPASNGHAFAEPAAEEKHEIEAKQLFAVEPAGAATAPSAQSFDDELAAAIDAEIGDLVSGRRARPETVEQAGRDALPFAAEDETISRPAAMAEVARGLKPAKRGSGYGSLFAGFRRALFRG